MPKAGGNRAESRRETLGKKIVLTSIIFSATYEGRKLIVAGAPMLQARIYAQDWEVDKRLAEFDVTRAELVEVVQRIAGERANAVDDDPVTAPGLFAYIYGTRFIRQLFKSKKWRRHRQNNIEAVKHPDKEWLVVYQSVDLAASSEHLPQAISGKGSGADSVISERQGKLFPAQEIEKLVQKNSINSGVWFLCVSFVGDDVRAELSLPSSLKGGNFARFFERIFIVRKGEWGSLKMTGKEDGGDAAEFEPKVTRK